MEYGLAIMLLCGLGIGGVLGYIFGTREGKNRFMIQSLGAVGFEDFIEEETEVPLTVNMIFEKNENSDKDTASVKFVSQLEKMNFLNVEENDDAILMSIQAVRKN